MRIDLLTNSSTGGSAIMAVQVLKARGVPEERILFLNLIASPEGISNFVTKFPRLKVVTAFIDEVSSTGSCRHQPKRTTLATSRLLLTG
jgi:hypothetical protein